MKNLSQKFEEYLSCINSQQLADKAEPQDREKIYKQLENFKNESRITLNLVEKYLHKDARILEVGAGLCILSVFLHNNGFKITPLEPLANGFGPLIKTRNIFFDNLLIDKNFKILDIYAEDLEKNKHGEFDLIFSNNVIEHIPKFNTALQSMTDVLSKSGKMIHNCPNYLVPYEPHFEIPTLHFAPQLSKVIFSKKINKNIDVWNSINFITYSHIYKFAKKNELNVKFKEHLIYDSFERLKNDPVFLSRHNNPIIRILLLIFTKLNLFSTLKLIPPKYSTPMIFTINK